MVQEAKKNICFVVATPLTAKSFLMKHFEVLSKEFDIYLVANFESFPFPDSSYLTGKYHLPINRKVNLLSDIKCLFKLYLYFTRMRFDAVQTVTPKAALLGIVASKLAEIKNRIHIFTGQVWYTKTGISRFGLICLDKLISLCATKILVDSKSQRKFLINQNIITEEGSAVLGSGSISGADNDRFYPTPDTKMRIRKELSFEKEHLVFGFLGRLTRDKGIFDLSAAFKKLNYKYPNIKLLIIGTDEENISGAIKSEIGSNVIFYGHSDNPEIVLQACDVFCLPSYREGFGTSVIEASLLGIAVICSDTYGLYDTIIDNHTGLRHEAGNVDDLYDKMETLILDTAIRTQLGLNGREYIKLNFSAEIISREWFLFYKQLLYN